MSRSFQVRSRAAVAMQALAIVERLVELDFSSLWYCPQVLNVNVRQTPRFVFQPAKHGVVRVTGIAGPVPRNAIVLEVRGRQVTAVVYVEAPTIVLHRVAREAEFRSLGAIHMLGNASPDGHRRQQKQCEKCEDAAVAYAGNVGS